jgi:hypothetical protein
MLHTACAVNTLQERMNSRLEFNRLDGITAANSFLHNLLSKEIKTTAEIKTPQE